MKPDAHILVIRLSAMGDVAMTVPVLLALTRSYPELRITVLTRAFFAPIFAPLPNVSVYEADVKGTHKGIIGLWKLYKALKTQRFTCIADLHNVLRSNVLKLFFRLGGTPFVQIDKGRSEKKALTAPKKRSFKQLKSTHQRYADVFEQLGYSINLKKTDVYNKETLSSSLVNLIGSDTKKWIGIAPFAAFEGKKYPLHLLTKVVEALQRQGRYKIVLFGGGDEEKALLDQFSEGTECINTIGKLSFSEELNLVSNLDVMLAMDSGNAHLAAMYGIPTVTIWGVTHPYAGFAPFGQEAHTILADQEKYPLIPTSVYGNKAPEGYGQAIATISPRMIVQKIEELVT